MLSKSSLQVVAVLLPLVLTSAAAQTPPSASFEPVTDAMLQNPAAGDWLMWRRTLDSWGYSPLDQIDRENVSKLRMVWTRALADGTSEATPLAYNGMLYVPQVTDIIEAIDATTGDLVWEYHRDIPESLYARVGFNARNNRNIAIYGRNIINTSDDNHIFAIDAQTGEMVWETEILDYDKQSATHSSGPIIADGLAISGRSCRPWGGPDACIIAAHDAKTGEEVWRRRLIPRPGEPGDETWGDIPEEQRQHVGSWMVPSYDPDLKLVYLGTSVTSPAPKMFLGGIDKKHLYHNSTLALAVATGRIEWYYQHLNDHWDLDHPFERILVDTVVAPDPESVSWINPTIEAGEERRVMTGVPGKTGVVYTLDRETGEFLWATPTIRQNVVLQIDGTTGEVTENPEVVFREVDREVFVCPGFAGFTEAGAYSPRTRLMYYPLNNSCMTMIATRDTTSPRARALSPNGGLEIYSLSARHELVPGTDDVGTVRAISVETGETTWIHEQRAGTSSVVATGGGLVFGGDLNGRFRAFDDSTGEVLWEINLGRLVAGYPISYAVNGRQYVAVTTGHAHKTALTPEIEVSENSAIFVFALPETDPHRSGSGR